MDNLARQLKSERPELVYGHVVARTGDLFSVRTEDGPLQCERADGCLLLPATGDLVLVSTMASAQFGRQGFVLSVIKKSNARRASEIQHTGDLLIRTSQGDLNVTSDNNLSLIAADRTALLSKTLTAGAESAELKAGSVSVAARLFKGSYQAVSLVAGRVEHVFSRLTQKMRNSVRMVEEYEEVLTGSSRLAVKDNYVVQTKNTFQTAEEIIKIDAEEVHLG